MSRKKGGENNILNGIKCVIKHKWVVTTVETNNWGNYTFTTPAQHLKMLAQHWGLNRREYKSLLLFFFISLPERLVRFSGFSFKLGRLMWHETNVIHVARFTLLRGVVAEFAWNGDPCEGTTCRLHDMTLSKVTETPSEGLQEEPNPPHSSGVVRGYTTSKRFGKRNTRGQRSSWVVKTENPRSCSHYSLGVVKVVKGSCKNHQQITNAYKSHEINWIVMWTTATWQEISWQ